MAGISTHVLDITTGRPLVGLQVELYDIATEPPTRLVDTRTNADGRTDQPLLSGTLPVGSYELTFAIGDYFRHLGTKLAEPAFLDRIPLRFGVADPSSHYHVPLLLSAYSYSTYRGS